MHLANRLIWGRIADSSSRVAVRIAAWAAEISYDLDGGFHFAELARPAGALDFAAFSFRDRRADHSEANLEQKWSAQRPYFLLLS